MDGIGRYGWPIDYWMEDEVLPPPGQAPEGSDGKVFLLVSDAAGRRCGRRAAAKEWSTAAALVCGAGNGADYGPFAAADPEQALSQITPGAKIAVYRPDDDGYCLRVVAARQPQGRHAYRIRYEDRETEATWQRRYWRNSSSKAIPVTRRISTILRQDLGKHGDRQDSHWPHN